MTITRETKLCDNLRLFQKILDAIPCAVILIDGDNLILFWNRSAEKIFGYDNAEVKGKDICDFIIPPENKEVYCAWIRQIKSTHKGEFINKTIRVDAVDKNKNEIPVDLCISPIFLNDNLYIVGTLKKAADQQKIREELEKVVARYQSIIELTHQLAWTTDAQGLVVEDIPYWRAFTGQKYEDILGAGWSDALHPEDKKRTMEIWKKAINEKTDYEVEYRVKRFDEVYRWFLARGIPVLRDDGSIREWVGTCIDITDRKMLAEEKIKQLEEISHSKTEFVSLASHQLQTPLVAIRWLVELILREKSLPEKVCQNVQDIHRSIRNLSMMIDMLLNVSRIEMGRIGVFSRPFNATEAIQTIISDFKPIAAQKNIGMTLEKGEGKFLIVSDENLFRHILNSLLSNALDYTGHGGEIKISLKMKRPNFLIGVRDNGVGIPEKEQEKLFEKFFRASNAKKVKPDGNGLGLYITKEAVKLLGGKIWFESQEGRGSAFFVELPLTSKNNGDGMTLSTKKY